MSLSAGQAVAHYRVVEKIGEGGMGEVYRAEDTRLGRSVALKVLPQAFARDADRMARFGREAQVLASLNHPAIGAIYGLEEAGDTRCLVLELVEGPTLAERIGAGPIPLDEALTIARELAGGLEAAHERGVIHRDLKPANVKLTPDGKVKILDFGLAKALGGDAASGEVSLSPTLTAAATQQGVILGTAAYMSPEQARGQIADRRADIWSFGVVLHEMLTGRRLFGTETVSETLAAVLRDPVSMDDLPGGLPAPVPRLLARCLDRDPTTRLRDIGEARIALSPESLDAGGDAAGSTGPFTPSPATGTAGRRAGVVPWLLAALMAVLAGAAVWQTLVKPSPRADLLTLAAPISDELWVPGDQMGVLALAPDGETLALVLGRDRTKMLYVRRMDSSGLRPMPGTEGAATPFFSPDSQWIGFFAEDKLKKIPVVGGSPITLCEAQGSNRGASWGTDDFIIFSPHYTRPLMRVAGAGGEPTVLTEIDKTAGERTHRWPQALPGEDLVLFTVGTVDSPESYDRARIQAIRPSTGERRTILEAASMARYLPTGHLVFSREGFLFAAPFDVRTLEVRGSPVPVVEGVRGMRNSGVSHFGVSHSGLLAYYAGGRQSRQSRLEWRTRSGDIEPLPAPVAGYVNPRISPDRSRIAVQVEGATTFDISTYHLEKQTLTRLTFEGDNTNPAWSPDGSRLSFASVRGNRMMSFYTKAADGSGQAELIASPEEIENSGQVEPWGWTPDGGGVIVAFTNTNASNLGVVSMEGRELTVVLETPAEEGMPALSPDGRWLAYASDEGGDFQIFVRAWPGPGGKWQVSSGGGVAPLWSPDGRELLFRWRDKLHTVAVDTSGGSFRSSRPEVVLEGLEPAGATRDYAVMDPDRFLVVKNILDDSTPDGVTVVVNWLDDLQSRVPID